MLIRFLLVLWLVQGAWRGQADATNLPVKIGAAEVAQHYDQLLTVTGMVAQVSVRAPIVFINLDHRYPDSPFAAVILSKDTNQFVNLTSLEGKRVEITGKVVKFHNRPEIVLEKASQLLIVGGNSSTNATTVTPVVPSKPDAPKGTNDLKNGVM